MNKNVIVLFEVTVKDGKMDDYLSRAGNLKEHLKDMKGFISAERFSSLATEGKLLSLSVWENEDAIKEWRNFAQHRESQQTERISDFVDYKITVVTPIRTYTMTSRDNAPVDSNNYFKVD